MSKKIGILTFHQADNHGAVLQAYALRKILNNFPNCCAEIINYVPEGYCYVAPRDENIKKLTMRKREKFQKFLVEQCGLDKPMIRSVTGNEYDIYLVGSDQVWNTDLPEVRADYEYFLPHLEENARKAAYSASIGMDFDRINRDLFRKYLPKFSDISLREKSYIGIVNELSGKNCVNTLDPTMLLDREEYGLLVEEPEMHEEPYILYFSYNFGDGGLESVETVNMLARKYGLSVKHTFQTEESLARKLLVKDGGCILHSGIGEFLWYVKNAEMVATNSFHGAVFSLIFRKPLYIFYPPIRSCRQKNLVELLNLQDRVVEGYWKPDQMNLEVDYASVFSIIRRERKKSVDYLRRIVESVG